MNKVFSTLVVLSIAAMLISMTFKQEQEQKPAEPWDVPAEYKTMKNPVPADDTSIKLGRIHYIRHCASCHGRTGKGDGVKARELETFPGDMTGEAYKTQTDGEQYYKSMFGRKEMPNYEDQVSEEDMWHMVNYMQTFE